MLYVDIPSLGDLKSLAAHRDDICVSIYLPTTPVNREAAGDRIELKNLAKRALRQLETANADKRRVAALMEHLDDLGARPDRHRDGYLFQSSRLRQRLR